MYIILVVTLCRWRRAPLLSKGGNKKFCNVLAIVPRFCFVIFLLYNGSILRQNNGEGGHIPGR